MGAHGVIPLQDPITAKLTALWGDEELDFVSMRGRLISALFSEGLPEDAEPLVHCLLEEDTELNVHPETLEFVVFFMRAWQKLCRAGVEPQLNNALEYMLMLSNTHGLPMFPSLNLTLSLYEDFCAVSAGFEYDFQSLFRDTLGLADSEESLTLSDRQVLLRCGEKPDFVYVVKNGVVASFMDNEVHGGLAKCNEICPNRTGFGTLELQTIFGRPASYTWLAVGPVDVVRYPLLQLQSLPWQQREKIMILHAELQHLHNKKTALRHIGAAATAKALESPAKRSTKSSRRLSSLTGVDDDAPHSAGFVEKLFGKESSLKLFGKESSLKLFGKASSLKQVWNSVGPKGSLDIPGVCIDEDERHGNEKYTQISHASAKFISLE